MSQRTNLKKAFKIARMVMPYGAGRSAQSGYLRQGLGDYQLGTANG